MIDTSKVIHAPVGGGRYTVTAPIVKEDYGLYLKIEGLELPSTYEVDFSNSEHNGTSVTMIGNADGVLIPNQFISSGKDVFAFLYHVGADFGRTIYKFRIPNKLRPDRTNEQPTPEQQSAIDQAIAALNDAVEQTAQDVIDADASAQSASADADRAEEARTDAQNYATQAEQSATDAHESASQASSFANAAHSFAVSAQTSAQSAEQTKTEVESMADDAQASASASAQSATASANSASQASASATSASQSATSAQGYASQAQTSAQTASSKASEASGYASTASTKASESAQSASQALTYKTDAESAKTASQTAQGLAESARDSAISAQESAEDARDEAQSIVDGISGKVEQIDSNTERIESLEDDIYKPYAVDSASGAIASFVDGADGIPLKSLIVNIDPVQDTSSGDPSPENICPISGWEGMNLRKCNANLWDDEWYTLGNTMNLITDEASDFYGYYRGAVASWANAQRTYGLKNLFPNGVDRLTVTADYACASDAGAFNFRVYFYYSDGTNAYNSNIEIDALGKRTATRTSVSGKKCVGFVISTNAGTSNYRGAIKNIIVSADGVTNFIEPVQNPFIPISWQTEAGTVYGGQLDVLSGALTAEWAKDQVTYAWLSAQGSGYIGVTANVSALNSRAVWIRNWNYKKIGTWKHGGVPSKCNAYVVSVHDSDVYSSQYRIYFAVADGVTVEDFKTSVQNLETSGDGLWICYKLATPIVYQLTPYEVNSLLGQNNIFADTGDTVCEYRADTKLYIEKLTQPEEDDMVANSAIASGQFFMIGNSLYKALTAIASGATITVGTNAQRVSLADALNLINT